MPSIAMLAATGAALSFVAAVAFGSTTPPQAACAATTVRYAPAKHPTYSSTPWVLARPERVGVVGYLLSYPRMLRDGRVNDSDGLVLWQTRTRIGWHVFGDAARKPTVVAQRVDGPGSFRVRLTRDAHGFVSTPRFPAEGCWRLTVRLGSRTASLVARVVAPPSTLACDATPVTSSLALVRPRAAGIAGGWTWRTEDGRALMYTHGAGPDGLNAKVFWWVRQNWGGSLRLTGTRLDGRGRFTQEFWQAGEPSSLPPGYRAIFPSIVDVPSAGCWLFRVQTGRLAGALIVRAVDR